MEIEGRALKANLVLDPAAVLALPPPANGTAKAVVLQGKLVAGDVLAEAGISAMPKATKGAAV